MTGFETKYRHRRQQARQTWFPSDAPEMARLQEETGMVLRFAIGDPPAELEQDILQEEEASGPFLRIPGKVRDTYKTLTFKTVAFWEVVAQHFSVQYVIKVDDDSYVRLDRLAIAIGQWQAIGAEYIGCFKVRDNSENRLRLRTHRWYDPHHELFEGDASFYAEGPFYVLPGPTIDGIVRSGLTVRMGGPNEDIMTGWLMKAFNVSHYDDRRLCYKRFCDPALIAFQWDHSASVHTTARSTSVGGDAALSVSPAGASGTDQRRDKVLPSQAGFKGHLGQPGSFAAGGLAGVPRMDDGAAAPGPGPEPSGRQRPAGDRGGGSARGKARGKQQAPPAKPRPRLVRLSDEMMAFFTNRGISPAVVERNGIQQEKRWSHKRERYVDMIAFPYYRNGELVNVKYRSLDKEFSQVPKAEKVLFGLDDCAGASEIIIVEGEMDKLALEEAGFRHVVSVPDGAPPSVREGALPPPEEETKFAYLWNCRAVLDQAARIILATDGDAPGQALAEELARRLGRDRCWRVRWPTADEADEQQSQAGTARKDANEVIMKDGREELHRLVAAAEPYPIRGLFKISDFFEDIWASYAEQDSQEQGVSTGWKGLDPFYRVVPGELSIVTGVPNSGKSEWIDALLCNLAEQCGWSFAMCSMEKKARDHARQLLEKHVRKPFFAAQYAGNFQRMEPEAVQAGLSWLDQRFHLIRYEDDELPSVDFVLDIARAAVLRYGIRGLVIDPYNELDHQRPPQMTETEYVSQMLTKIKRFAQHYDVHVWFVAHPRQLRDWKGDPPNLYDISGSAHFINKADNGIVIHRNRDPARGSLSQVQVLVRKVRNKAAGTIGECLLEYRRATGRYEDAGQS
ncbi:hypothetical protein WJX81_006707 [Elliptochloris bilobata]|uniref:SF4 helicase domain-containing protein n=1 Tax=Elliptochloris bilobata TaxID=381761 RepID=A0AAW1RJ33_9CHLO